MINDSVHSDLQKWMIFHPFVIHSPIINDNIRVELNDWNIGENIELHQKVLLKVYVHEIHIFMLKKYATGFSMAYDEKIFFCMNDYGFQLLLSLQLLKMKHHHTIQCCFKIITQDGTCQDSLNHWIKVRLQCINNCAK